MAAESASASASSAAAGSFGGEGGGGGGGGGGFGEGGGAAASSAAASGGGVGGGGGGGEGGGEEELPAMPEADDGALRVGAPGPNLPEVVFLPVSVRPMAIGDHELLVWECEAEKRLWGFVKSSHRCQMGRVQVVGKCRRRADGRVRFIKPYTFAALKAQSKREVELTAAGRAAGRGGDDTVLEKAILASLADSPHIATLLSIWHDSDNVYTLLEYLRGGELTDVINHSPMYRMSESVVRAVVAQILLGLRALHHGLGYAHCDLSPENVLFEQLMADPGGCWTARLIDFGAARPLLWEKDGEVREGVVGFEEEGWEEVWGEVAEPFGKGSYLEPQYYLRKKHRRRQLDLWAVGVIVYVALCGEYLYDRPVPADPGFASLLEGKLVDRLSARMRETGSGGPSANCVDFICGLLDPDPEQRPEDVDQLLQHPWIYEAAKKAQLAAQTLQEKKATKAATRG